MRVTNPSAAPAPAQTADTKSAAPTPSPVVGAGSKAAPATVAKPAFGFAKNDEFSLTRPRPTPLPFPRPPVFQPDAQTRATQASQLERIGQGVGNGSITAQEAESLLKQQASISDYQRQAMADGFLSQEERLRLNGMQASAALNTFMAANNSERGASGYDPLAQHQAGQIFQIARGVRDGNITNVEAGGLLRDQVKLADARSNANSLEELYAVRDQLRSADFDIRYHSQPGTQFTGKPFPLPQPQPRPLPSMPRPELPSKPDLQILPFRGVITG